ncbi:MAG: hypothetical protein DLM58_07195 [Pseudonocardiales bacterium]|nr:MAG: hypothetical protein DLM58_07195 [Pseudonocardiales bacterium]
MGVVQEKSTRVVEVILCTVRPVDLLVGKVLGAAAGGFTQGGLLVATALISAEFVGSNGLEGSGAADIVVVGVWIVIGFLLYAAMFTAANALASQSGDAQSVGLPLQIPLLTTGVVLWLASMIFRRSILRTGQWVRLRQLLRERPHSATAPA